MTFGCLVNTIKKADYLSDDRKDKLLKIVPMLGMDQLSVLVGIISWAEKEKERLAKQKKLIMAGLHRFFASMNNEAIKKTKKVSLKYNEKMDKQNEEGIIDEMLKNM